MVLLKKNDRQALYLHWLPKVQWNNQKGSLLFTIHKGGIDTIIEI